MKIIFNTDIVALHPGKKPKKRTILVDQMEFEEHVFGLIKALSIIKKWDGRNAFEVHPEALSIQKFLKKSKKSITDFALLDGEEIYAKALSDIELICNKAYCYQGAFIMIEL